MNKQNQLAEIHNSGKAYIIYKSKKGFDLYTNFSKKIILNNKNVNSFLSQRYKSKLKNTDLFIGFFGYELLNNLINIKIPKQKNMNFPLKFILKKFLTFLLFKIIFFEKFVYKSKPFLDL